MLCNLYIYITIDCSSTDCYVENICAQTYIQNSTNTKALSCKKFYGRTLSDASMLYFADVFFIFFLCAP